MKEDQEQYVQGLKYELEDDKNAKRKDLNEWDKKLMQGAELSEQEAYRAAGIRRRYGVHQ